MFVIPTPNQVRMIPEGERVSDEAACGIAMHGAYEMATLGAILPELFTRFKDL